MNFSETDIFPQTPLQVLVIGYGNPMRTDDGAGPAVASLLAHSLRSSPNCRCDTAHQLVPEHAEELLYAPRVLFIDASVDVPPGQIRISRLLPSEPSPHNLTHHLAPQTLLWMTSMLFGRVPQAWSVAIGAADLSVGNQLSAAVAKTCDRLSSHLAFHLQRWSTHSAHVH
ncbi:MAG TPA: hydrogenase maturation protease [Phycisphaerae bacterium]|nr:hydrogenase maturation protease [Phycisphaerae bacterium]